MKDNAKTYPAPWQGQLILACRKCQKKLKGDPDLRALAKLKKTVKRQNKEHPEQILHVINVSCMDLCPKDGVTVCDLARSPSRLMILRSEGDIERLFHAS
jgi:predicted metal-binding protein